jgi:hypothetical protein
VASETEQLAGGYWENVTGDFIRGQLSKALIAEGDIS